jgi:hypothetical protein
MKSLREIARKEGVDSSYVSRMVNLMTLAPDILAAILGDALSANLTLFDVAVDPPALWEEQRGRIDGMMPPRPFNLAPLTSSPSLQHVLYPVKLPTQLREDAVI